MHRRLMIWLMFLAIVCMFFAAPAKAAEPKRFTDNKDGTITDRRLHLMWAAADNQGNIDWKSADRWVRFTFPNTLPVHYENWRMPTLSELSTLYVDDPNYEGYETDCGQRVRIIPLIRLSCGWVWTGETKSITARVFNFNRGYHYTDRMVHKRAYRALPVRDLATNER